MHSYWVKVCYIIHLGWIFLGWFISIPRLFFFAVFSGFYFLFWMCPLLLNCLACICFFKQTRKPLGVWTHLTELEQEDRWYRRRCWKCNIDLQLTAASLKKEKINNNKKKKLLRLIRWFRCQPSLAFVLGWSLVGLHLSSLAITVWDTCRICYWWWPPLTTIFRAWMLLSQEWPETVAHVRRRREINNQLSSELQKQDFFYIFLQPCFLPS